MVRRCQSYLDARVVFEDVRDGFLIDKPNIKGILPHFQYWLNRYLGGRVVRLRLEDKFVFIRMVNRFMERYKKRVKARLMLLKNVSFTHMFSLTVDRNSFSFLKDEFKWIHKQFARFRAWLTYMFGKFDYIKVLEVTKKGRPHLHVLVRFLECEVSYIPYSTIYDVNGKVVYKGIRELWGAFGWVRRVWKGFAPVSYCIKYLNKSMKFDGNLEYGALLFASNCHMFSLSHRLYGEKRVVREKVGYVFDGVVGAGVLDWYVQEKGLSLESMVYKFDWDSSYLELFEGVEF